MTSLNKIRSLRPNIKTSWVYTEFSRTNPNIDDDHINKALAGHAPYAEDISIKLIKWYNEHYYKNNNITASDLIGFLLNVMQESSKGLKRYLNNEQTYEEVNQKLKFQVFSNEFYFYLLTVFNKSNKIKKNQYMKQALGSLYALNENITPYAIAKIVNASIPKLKFDRSNINSMIYHKSKDGTKYLTEDGEYIFNLKKSYQEDIENCKNTLTLNLHLLAEHDNLFADSIALWDDNNCNNIIEDIINFKK